MFCCGRVLVLSTIYAISISDKAATGGFLYKKLFLNVLQYSQENACVGVSFLLKFQALSPAALLKRESNAGIFLRILRSFQEHLF